MMYEFQCWAIYKKKEIKVIVAEMRMLKWICNMKRMDRITNEYRRSS